MYFIILVQVNDDGTALNAKLMGIERKWNDICHRLHPTRSLNPDILQTRCQTQHAESFQFVADRKENSSKDSCSNDSRSSSLVSSMPMDLLKVSPLKQIITSPMASKAENANFQPRLPVETSSSHKIETESPRPPTYSVCSLSLQPDRTSLPSFTSVTTDLGLGTLYAITSQEPGNLKSEDHKSRRSYISGSVSTEFVGVRGNASNHIASPSSCCPELGEWVDPQDLKSFWRELAEKVGYQEEAICTVSQTISRCRTGHGTLRGSHRKGDIWFSFLGHDKVGKRRIAAALAEVYSGDRENLIYVDLSSEDGMSRSDSIFGSQDLRSYYIKLRRKTIVDYIAEELSRKRHSIVLLENVDKADPLAQSSLSRAIRTGKFPDSHGREISINNVIFVTTSNATESSKEIISGKKHVQYSEERILGAKRWQMQVLVGCVSGHATGTNPMNASVMPRKENLNPKSANKRKLIDMNDSMEQVETLDTQKYARKSSKSYLDLNLPVGEEEEEDPDYGNCDSNYNPENYEAWLEEFFGQVDEKVVFKPFDFDALAKELMKEIDRIFRKVVGSEFLLEIGEEVMVQILAAAWLSERKRAVEDWIEQVLGKGFAEAQQRHELTAQSVVKLVACEGLLAVEQAPGICLPARIIF